MQCAVGHRSLQMRSDWVVGPSRPDKLFGMIWLEENTTLVVAALEGFIYVSHCKKVQSSAETRRRIGFEHFLNFFNTISTNG
jgi:hypothetical protein